MAMVRRLSLKLYHLFLLSFIVCTTAIGSTIFTEHPTDTSVMEGSDATFRCGTDLTCSFFYWGRYQANTGTFSYISKCLSSYDSQYAIEVEGNVYTLLVQDVSLEDTGTVFECWQYNQQRGKWLASRNATLTVQPLSTGPEPPICRTNPDGPHAIGDQISLECSGEKSEVLSWQTAREGRLGDMAKVAPGLPNKVEWTLTEQTNFETYVCTAGAESNGTSCSVTPLAIPTNVTISPSGTLSVADGQDAEFHCEAQAVPDVTSYKWLINKDGETHTVDQVKHFVTGESGGTLRIINASIVEDGLEVACEATNVLNITGISLPATLRVQRARVEYPRITKSSFSTNRGTNNVKGQDTLTDWSHMTLVIGIMLCIVVMFIAAGMGLLYARWRRRMNGPTQEPTPPSPSPNDNTPFSLHDPEADFRRGSLGAVRACVALDCSPLQQFGVGSKNDYTEVFGNQASTSAPAHEKAVASEPIYERHF